MSSTELLIKCLALTQSDNDGEALTAIRKANIIRDKMGQTWEGLVSTTSPQGYNKSGTNTYYEQPQRNQWTHPEPDFDYDGYFLFIYRHNTPTGKWAEIIGSIKSQWEANGHLSDKQGSLVKKFYKTAQDKHDKWKAAQDSEPVDER